MSHIPPIKRKPRVLFILKTRLTYGISYGLINSCHFVHNALEEAGIESKVVTVVDNNSIDKVIHDYKPTHAIIEALWVEPEKFHVLLPLHKDVLFNIRLHSKTPFLISEGIAFEWLFAYNKLKSEYDNFTISSNNDDLIEELHNSLGIQLKYTPNFYHPDFSESYGLTRPNLPNQYLKEVNIGCFGALRILKNQGIQALAAIAFCNSIGKKLKFHINNSRLEHGGESIIKNLRAIFDNCSHELVEHEWINHKDFVCLVKSMDIGLQVSYTESYNIIAGDFVFNYIPIVGSEEIRFLDPDCVADPTLITDIVKKLSRAYSDIVRDSQVLQKKNKKLLDKENKKALKVWRDFLGVI
jgi:hypothetical protein